VTLRNCAVVTLPSGTEAIFHNCDADEYVIGELTIENRATKAERIFRAGTWNSVTVFDYRGNYLYVIDKHPQPVRFVDFGESHASYR